MSNNNRRTFLKVGILSSLGSLIEIPVVHAKYLPKGLSLIGLEAPNTLPGKNEQMIVLNDRPINAEAPPHLLDHAITPAEAFFVRNNGIPPERSNINVDAWTLTIEGEAAQTKQTYTLKDLQSKFQTISLQLTLECGGNGRSEFNPPAKGNQWTTGAVGCAKWTGVRLKDVLEDAGIKSTAVYIGYYGADNHLSGDPGKEPISRGVPIDKALEENSLIAWAMNDDPLPLLNGYPLRLVFGGWPASCSGKWLERIVIRNRVHDGAKMGGSSYRTPCDPVAPGTKVADEDMCIIESMPVKSLITYPKTGAMVNPNQKITVRGHAWAGEHEVSEVEVSTDFGATWQKCSLTKPANKYAWQQFQTEVSLAEIGYYEIWAKATDENGVAQPMIVPGWNPKGYLNNACHRIALKVQ